MKYVFILADGMADWPIEALGGKTPMTVADKPHINAMAAGGITGLCQTVPPQFSPGSDVANLSVLGYPPAEFYTGRSSLEAASAGVLLRPGDVTLRANLVHISDEPVFADKTMIDYSGGEVASEDAAELLRAVAAELDNEEQAIYPGISYRNILLRHNAQDDTSYKPAHDIMGQRLGDNLPQGNWAEAAVRYMERAHEILKKHPYNIERVRQGKIPADALWLWGPGTRPALPSFRERYGLKGGVVSAVDLIRGIGISAGMDILYLSSATGGVVTDFRGKGEIAAAYLQGGGEFVFVHIEAPDESGHQNLLDKKISAIERIDQETIPPILDALAALGEDYRMIVMPDHATPLAIRTHARDAVPFVIFDSRYHRLDGTVVHDEARSAEQGLLLPDGQTLIQRFLDADFH
ncbi:MAG: cofactor-independent phosphoglycerate mutase [Firmicutes bacterium]|nr:cofactor-independent phosphoglycerate mutase [Bacillota bacterium]